MASMMKPFIYPFLLFAAFFMFSFFSLTAQEREQEERQESVFVAAASDLQAALPELITAFNAVHAIKISVSFGSSGHFYRQIREGAPFAIFLSADEAYALNLYKDGMSVDDGHLYALGRLVLFLPPHSALKADASLQDLRAALEEGRLKKFAIANPDHAPYGRAAREVLRANHLWETIEKKLVLGENVAQAAQFALSARCDGAIIAYSLALSPALASSGRVVLLPQEGHQPLRQRMVLTKKAGKNARLFYAYLQSAEAQRILAKHGFTVPKGLVSP